MRPRRGVAHVGRSATRFASLAALGFIALSILGPITSTPAYAAGATCSGLSYAGCNLEGVDFTGQNLAGADFSGANLVGANFSGVNLQGANFNGANLQSANLSSANMQSATLVNADFSGANLQNVNLQYTDSRNVNFNNADLTGAHLQHGTFTGCTDENAILTGIQLTPAAEFCNRTPPNVVPAVNCVSTNSDGSFVAYFGYTNSGSVLNVPIGPSNSITPASLSGSQPTTFVNGTVSNAFSVMVPSGGTAQWSVNGASTTATSNTTACEDQTLPADPNGMSLVYAVAGGALVGAIVVRRAARGHRFN